MKKTIITIAAALSFAGAVLTAQPRYAVVDISVNFLREAPDYTAELGTQALMGTVVEITGEEGYWRQVVTPEPYTAWCTELGLVEMGEKEIEAYMSAPKYICTAWHSTIYSEPSAKSQKITDIVAGDIMRVSGERSGRFTGVLLPSGIRGYVLKQDVEESDRWQASREPSARNIIKEAMKFIGVPYLWGGASVNGVDCSGFTRLVFQMNGISLPRNASQQARSGTDAGVQADISFGPDSEGLSEEMHRRAGTLEPGDLIFFGAPSSDGSHRITHVGIYIGDGKFIHSSHKVRLSSLFPEDDLYYENSYKLLSARRIIPGI
ncbi:MAG: NlpC/P60 family protein [Bacteroidales bacterium]|nr:NlpC/P60 family protein [Bacteroidales bacterium]